LRNTGFNLSATFVDAAGERVGGGHIEVPDGPPINALDLDQRGFADEVKQLGRSAPPEWKALAAFQNSTVWKNDPAADFQWDGRTTRARRADVLSWLTHRANIEFVADYYSRPFKFWTEKDKASPLTRSLKAELDYRAADQDMSWKRQESDVYLFRDNRWYRDDELEVPNDLLRNWLRRWADLNRAQPAPADRTAPMSAMFARRVLDLWSDIFSKLTLYQLNNGLKFAVAGQEGEAPLDVRAEYIPASGAASALSLQLPFGNLTDLIMEDRNVLRFYGGLNEDQKTLLLGGRLPYAELSDADQRGAAYLQPLLPYALRQTQEPVLLGLTAPVAEGHGYFSQAQREASWPNQTHLCYLFLETTSPHLFPEADSRSIR
jgi:hypothetical protein